MTTTQYGPSDPPEPEPLPPITLTEDEECDLQGLLVWAFMREPGIPYTRVLGELSGRLTQRKAERRARI